MDGLSLTGALAALRAATDLAKAAFQARDDRLIDKVISDMNDRFMDVQSQCLALQEKQFSLVQSERELKEKVRQLEKRNADFDSYELHRTARGGLVYRFKEPLESGNEPIDICANCVGQGVKTFLQPIGVALHCHIHGNVPSDKEPRKIDVKAIESPWGRKW